MIHVVGLLEGAALGALLAYFGLRRGWSFGRALSVMLALMAAAKLAPLIAYLIV